MNASKYGPYDADLEMYVELERDLDLRRLRFLRWLVEHGRLEHEVAGPAAGPLIELAADQH